MTMAASPDQQLAIEQEKTRREIAKIEAQSAAAAQKQQAQAAAAAQTEIQKKKAEAKKAAEARWEIPVGKAQKTELSQPAYQLREAAGSPLPKAPAGWLLGLAPPIGGAAVTGIFSGVMPADERWEGYMITLVVGAIMAIASPYGAWPESAGAGMMAASALGLYMTAVGEV